MQLNDPVENPTEVPAARDPGWVVAGQGHT